MPQDRNIPENNPSYSTAWGEEGHFIHPHHTLGTVQSKTPSQTHQENIRKMSAASGLNPAPSSLPRGEGLPPTQGPVQSTRPLIHAGKPFTPGMRPAPPIDPDIRSRNRNPNASGIIVPRPDL